MFSDIAEFLTIVSVDPVCISNILLIFLSTTRTEADKIASMACLLGY